MQFIKILARATSEKYRCQEKRGQKVRARVKANKKVNRKIHRLQKVANQV